MLVYYVNKDEIEWYFKHDPPKTFSGKTLKYSWVILVSRST